MPRNNGYLNVMAFSNAILNRILSKYSLFIFGNAQRGAKRDNQAEKSKLNSAKSILRFSTSMNRERVNHL